MDCTDFSSAVRYEECIEHFQQVRDIFLSTVKWKFVLVYLDGVVILI